MVLLLSLKTKTNYPLEEKLLIDDKNKKGKSFVLPRQIRMIDFSVSSIQSKKEIDDYDKEVHGKNINETVELIYDDEESEIDENEDIIIDKAACYPCKIALKMVCPLPRLLTRSEARNARNFKRLNNVEDIVIE
jgi:hypothetical protein